MRPPFPLTRMGKEFLGKAEGVLHKGRLERQADEEEEIPLESMEAQDWRTRKRGGLLYLHS